MAQGLQKLANKLFGGDEVDRILAMPMTQLRLELKHAYQDKEFSEEQFNDFLDRLSKVDDISSQLDLAKKAVGERAVDAAIDIELNSPAKQLLWAAVFTRMMHTGTEPVARSTLWKQMQETIGVNNESIGVAKVISRSLQNDNVTFEYGQPGTWFYYDPKANHINLDLYYMLLVGFEHIRSVNLHEIGHSELSNTYSPRMKELYEKVKVLIDPRTIEQSDDDKAAGKKPRLKMKKGEYKQLMLDVAEWKLRFRLWHMTEDTVVNQFSTNMSKLLPQNFGNSLNFVSAILQGFGEIINGDDATRDVKISTNKPPPADTPERDIWEEQKKEKQDEANKRRDAHIKRMSSPLSDQEIKDIKAGNISLDTATKMFDQINTAVLLAFYEQNGLFKGSDKAWQRLRIITDDIRNAVDVSGVPGAAGKDAFEYLVDMSVGKLYPDAEVMKMPMERERALKFLEDRAKVEAATPALLDLDASFDAPDATGGAQATPEEKRRAAALEILKRKTVLGDAADQVEDPVEELFHIAARMHGIRNLQPMPSDRLLEHPPYNSLHDSYRAVVDFTAQQRGLVMEHIWDLYLKPYAEVILKAHEQKLDQDLNKKKDQKNQQQQGNQQGNQQQGGQQGGEGQQSEGGGGGGDSMPDTGQGDGESQKNSGGPEIEIEDDEPEEKDGNGKGDPGDDEEIDVDDDMLKDVGDITETPDEERAKEGGQQGKGQDKNKDKDKGNEKGEGQGKDGEPEDGEKQESGKGGKGWDMDDSPQEKPKQNKVSDLKNKQPVNDNLTDEQKEAIRKNQKGMPNSDQSSLERDNAGSGDGVDLAQLAKGDWRDFNARIQELAPVINRLARTYKKIRSQQRRQIRKMSRNHVFLPRDGDLRGRLDRGKVIQTKFKQATGQPITIEDLKKVKTDEPDFADSTIEFTAMIDGSGSMPMFDLGNGVTAMEVALQSAVINYMAARKAGIDAYIVMWGDSKPRVLATPDTPLKEVGEAVERVRNGIRSGTNLAPSFVSSIEAMANHKNNNGTISGSSHMLIYSDGDIGDPREAAKMLEIISRNAKNLSVDVAVLRPKSSDWGGVTAMENVFQGVIDKTGDRVVGIVRGNDAQQVPMDLAHRVLSRVKKFKVKVEPDSKKRGRLKSLHQQLKDS